MTRSSSSEWSIDGYVVHERLGVGGIGRVYRARSPAGETVALKLLAPNAELDDPRARDRLRREVAALSRISHPRVLPLLGHGEDAELGPYLVTPLLVGRTLRELIATWRPSPPAATAIIAALADATAAVHAAGLVHRDLKPENVMCTDDGRLVLIDLGLALGSGHTRYTEEGAVAGSAPYMAPEQIEGREVTPASDAWAIGVMLYELVAGRRPFQRATPREEVAAILAGDPVPLDRVERRARRELAELVTRCLAPEPAARFTAGELAMALAAFADADVAALLGPDRADAEAALIDREVARLVREATAAGDDFLRLRAIDQALAYRPGDPELAELAARVARPVEPGDEAPAPREPAPAVPADASAARDPVPGDARASREPAPGDPRASRDPAPGALADVPASGDPERAVPGEQAPRRARRLALAAAGVVAIATAVIAATRSDDPAIAPLDAAEVVAGVDAARADDAATAPPRLAAIDLATWPGLPASAFPDTDAPVDQRLLDKTRVHAGAPEPCLAREWPACEDELTARLAARPDDLDARRTRGRLRYRLGKIRAAHDDLLAVLHRTPTDFALVHELAHLAYYLDRNAEARTLLTAVVAARPDDADAWVDLAQTQAETEAFASLDRAAELAPRSPRVAETRCVMFAYFGRETAVDVCRLATRLAPSSTKAWQQLAVALHRAGHGADALAASDRALALAPRDVLVLVNRGVILDGLGRETDAMDAYRRACRLGHTAACSKLGPKR